MGLKALAYVHPFSFKFNLHDRSENPVYTYLDSLGLILKTTRTLDPSVYKFLLDDGQYDFYNPAMYEVWKSFMHQLLITDNFDGWMEDFGDIGYIYNTIEKKWEGIPFNIEYDMSDHEYFNMFPLVFHKLTYEVSTEHKKDVVTFSRSGSAGSAAYCPLIWGGDQTGSWDKKLGYPSSVTAAITSGLSGYGNWTPDILSDSPSKELWMRWVQFGAFTLVMRDHLWHYDPKTINLWTDESTQKFFKKYADIHTQLIPYLKTAAAQYQQTGCPVIRHMFLEFPEDKEALKCEYQYMLGDKLLVAPVVGEGAKSNNVYFPKGLWLDYWTKKEFSSTGEWMTVPAPLDIIPVFERIN
jgi:alpha-glucosidase